VDIKFLDEGKKTTLNESFYFTSEEVSSIERYKDNYADIVTEIPFTWKFNWVQYNVSIPIKIDSMIGLEIHKNEYKIVERETKLSLYENSIIWKIWLLATGAEKFQYNIYENLQSEQKIIYRSYVLFPFDGMKNEVLMLLDRYVRFCESRNLTQYVIKD